MTRYFCDVCNEEVDSPDMTAVRVKVNKLEWHSVQKLICDKCSLAWVDHEIQTVKTRAAQITNEKKP